ncbi:amino acid ABC transporter membrane protein 1, PAAT family [Tistlia consotensis]|uniref:Amino acid ABC transporter membrane protein 1, PAAT family n=1 Tax=Tistlia consotensis USBA 355 TaxID=560819 RepID=A0A1Y6BJY2_9PROT|nr:ABC transporter permease [Tistlia consotensis]SMF11741.1 amino acid ABC transporter membrane protein 1, PAAT family [Tistlia consotensis USBA 355]SNR51698.1 amino acid ABC transporter membrane protein 1, PAAT family [Tistlia consotensis]
MLQGWGDEILRGLGMTLLVGFCALGVALVMGLLGSWAKLSRSAFARGLATLYTTVVRGVPELLMILIVYYGTPTLIQNIAEHFGHDIRVDFNPFVAGVTTIGMIYGAFATEVFRGAFLALDKGQLEAARACGMGRALAFRRIMLPQVWRFALPGLGNLWLVLIKATALISVIQLTELLRWSDIAARNTRQPFTFFFVAACLYLLITLVSQLALHRAERWANRGIRRA